MASSDRYTIYSISLVRTTPVKDDCMILDGKGHEMASCVSLADHVVGNPEKAKK